MSSCCSVGANAKLSINDVRMDFISFDGSHVMKVLSDGSLRTIRGSLQHLDTDVQDGILFANFSVTMYLTAQKATTLLPLLGLGLGGTPPITNISGNTIPAFNVVLTTDGGLDFVFTDAKVGKWRLEGQKGSQPIMLSMSCSAQLLETDPAGTYTHGSETVGPPYAFTQGVYTLDSVSQLFDRFALSVDTGLVVEHNNSQTPTNICATDYDITLGTSVPFSSCQDTLGWMENPLAGLNEVAGILDFNNGVTQTKFNFASLIQILSAPSVIKTGLTRLPLHFRLYRTSSTPAISVVNDLSV